MGVPIFYNNAMAKYDFGYGHPFRGKRFQDFLRAFENLPGAAKGDMAIAQSNIGTRHHALLVHSVDYVDYLEGLDGGGGGPLSPDTYVIPGVLEGAYAILGSAVDAAEHLLSARRAGGWGGAATLGGLHHASRSHGEGFCILNDVAVCAEYLIRHGLKRVAIIDTDAHAGNGTMDIFYERSDVLFISIHQDPKTLYPGRCFAHEIGKGDGEGYTVNAPMPPHATWDDYRTVMDEIIRPVVSEFKPQIIIRNGGTDPYWNDRLTSLGLSMKGLFYLGRSIRDLASMCGAGLISMTVSGYGPHTIPGWLALLQGQFGMEYNVDYDDSGYDFFRHKGVAMTKEKTAKVVGALKHHLGEHWNL